MIPSLEPRLHTSCQGPLGPLPCVFLVFPLCNLIWNPVVLACKRTSVPSVPPARQEAETAVLVFTKLPIYFFQI